MSKDGKVVSTKSVINVASVPHRSPFRYPGGKTWLVPHVRKWLRCLKKPAALFAEPFAGGGIVGLSVLFDGLAEEIALVELDESVAAVWRTILNGKGKALAERISSFEMSRDAARDVLEAPRETLFDEAFATIIRNRVQRGGIMAPGARMMKDGENGRGVASRWYPQTLKKRILDIVRVKRRVHFVHGDGISYLQEHTKRKDMAFLIDPPYTVAGGRLYLHSEVDHEKLFRVTAKVKGDFLMTYDNVGPVRELAKRHGFDTQEVSMKNTHHAVMSELLIGRDLSWART